MKHNFLFLLILILGFSLNAQIEFTNNDLAPEGTTFYISNDTIPDSGISIGMPGPNSSWDFTALVEHYVDTIIFELPDWTPYPDDFPDANFAIESVSDSGFIYFIRNDDEFSGIGAVGPFQDFGILSAPVEPKEIVYDFPEQYGNSRDETYSIEVTVASSTPGVDSARIKKDTDKNSFVDAWGTMTLALGTYETIRVKEVRTEYDSIWAKTFLGWMLLSTDEVEKTSYSWLTDDPSIGYTLVSLRYNTEIMEIISVDYINTLPVAIVKREVAEAKVFPNPASTFINFDLENIHNAKLSIFDISGKMLDCKTVSSSKLRLSITNYKSGVYFYTITVDNEDKTYKGTFIKK